MKASKTLGRPENWQDFESLCKKLWGEIWRCPETKKNGRSGQDQSGVDVYGTPFNEKGEYYGIQCKGKDEYTHKQLTEKEIETEIENAKCFEPPLKKLYFATTAVKDAKIETIIRKKNTEHIKLGLFEVHLYSWEDIVDLIHENKETYDYYVRSINFKTSNSVAITFDNGEGEISIKPKYKNEWRHYRQRAVFSGVNSAVLAAASSIHVVSSYKKEINRSYYPFFIVIHNNGETALEEGKLLLEFEGRVEDIADDNVKVTGFVIPDLTPKYSNTYLNSKFNTAQVIPRKVIVGDDKVLSDNIFIKPHPEETEILVKWKFLSMNLKDSGELKILVDSEIVREDKTILVDDPLDVRVEEGTVEDYIETIEED